MTKKQRQRIRVVTITTIVLTVAAVALLNRMNWTTSTYSDYCYPVGQAHGNIEREHQEYYKLASDCNKPIKK